MDYEHNRTWKECLIEGSIYILGIAIAAMFMASTAEAQDVPEPTMMVLTKGVICDTEEQVEGVLTLIALRQKLGEVEGCGMIRGRVGALVTPMYWYETPAGKSLVARFDFVNGIGTQYGWVAFTVNPDYQPPKPKGKSV